MVVTRNRPSGEQPMLPVWSTNPWKEEIKRCRYNHLQCSEEGTYIPPQSHFRKTSSVGTQLYSLKIIKYTWYSPKSLAGVFRLQVFEASLSPLVDWKHGTHSWRVFPSSQHTAAPGSTWALSRCVKILSIWHNNIVLHPKLCFIKTLVLYMFFSAELRYKLYCTRTICTLIWDWFPIGHEITRNTIIHLKESEISITKHYFKLKVSRQKFYWTLKFLWVNMHSTSNMGQLQLLKAKPRLSAPQQHSASLSTSWARSGSSSSELFRLQHGG